MNHGTVSGYQAHMERRDQSCQPCRDAQAAWMRSYRIRRYLARSPLLVDATGTRRRLLALHRIGWTSADLGARLGISGSGENNLLRQQTVLQSTARRVVELYDELWDKPGPSVRVADYAKRQGWPPPLAWDDDSIDDPAARPAVGYALREQQGLVFDEVAVLRAMYGDPVHLRPSERAEATRRLTAAGLSAAQIAERLHTTKRSVVRQRNRTEEVA